jgi:hypothetical protein
MNVEMISTVGTVKALWRYPVKSMGGEGLEESAMAAGGINGDRTYAVIDQATGKVASAKHPRLWSKLLKLSAAFVEAPVSSSPIPPVRIRLTNGTEIYSNHSDCEARISEALGRPVVLTSTRPESVSIERVDPLLGEKSIFDIGALMAEGRFSDYADVHLLTTATLNRLAELGPDSRFDVRRFRPNVVIESADDQAGFVENDWLGCTVCIGNEVRLRVTDPSPRCLIPTLAQGDLDRDPGILGIIAAHNSVAVPVLDGAAAACVGVHAFVIQGGTVRRSDVVRIEPAD